MFDLFTSSDRSFGEKSLPNLRIERKFYGNFRADFWECFIISCCTDDYS